MSIASRQPPRSEGTQLFNAAEPMSKRLVAVLILTIIAGQLQGILTLELPQLGVVNYFDDALLLVAVALCVPRFPRLPALPAALIFFWILWSLFAMFRSVEEHGFQPGEMFFMFRQIAIPAIIMIVGMALRHSEWLALARGVIWVAIISIPYYLFELFIGRPVDPVAAAASQDDYIGYYNGTNIITGAPFDRLGGPILNPPIAGIFLAAAIVLILCLFRSRVTPWLVVILAALLILTGSRGGLLIAAIAIGLAWASPRLHPAVAAVMLTLITIPFALEIASHQQSGRHVDGLTTGLEDALNNFFGRGFGFVGNHRPGEITDGAGESLLGIAFSAGGIPFLAIIICVIVALLLKTRHLTHGGVAAAIALGGVMTAMFAESASALNGTLPIWLAAGFAFSSASDRPRSPQATIRSRDESLAVGE